MADDVLKVPVLNLEIPKPQIPKPKFWDFVALAVTLAGLVACGANLAASGIMTPGAVVSTPMTLAFTLFGLAVSAGSLLVLGKTAKEGTIHGNLFAVGGMMVGLGGAMLAAALWAVG